MGGGVQGREVAARRVAEEVDPLQAEVGAERLDVADLPVAAVRAGVGGHGARPGAPGVEEDERAVGVESAEVAEVGGVAHRPARQAHQRLALPLRAVGEFGSVIRRERRHASILTGPGDLGNEFRREHGTGRDTVDGPLSPAPLPTPKESFHRARHPGIRAARRLRELLRPVLRGAALRQVGGLRRGQALRRALPQPAGGLPLRHPHAAAAERFQGCTVYDCFGAGQRVSLVTFGGVSWREAPETARQMYEVFPVVRGLHELLRHLAEALALPAARPVHAEVRAALARVEALASGTPDALEELDVNAVRAGVNPLLLRTSELVRATAGGRPKKPARGGPDRQAAARGEAAGRGPARGAAHRRRPDGGGPVARRSDRCRPAGRRPVGRGPDGRPLPHAAPGERGPGNAATRLPEGFERPAHWTA